MHHARKRPDPSRGGKKSSPMRICVESLCFFVWLALTGSAGYFLGLNSLNDPLPCPQDKNTPSNMEIRRPTNGQCRDRVGSSGDASTGRDILLQLKDSWTCSRARYSNGSQSSPLDVNLEGTKWQNVIQIEPHAFFERYLQQYPGDMVSTRPVVAFSHRPAKTLDDLDGCKVMDVAIIPDTPGTCIAVTETFHDVASYHMLHAEIDPHTQDLSLVANHVAERTMPNEAAYSMARSLLLEYFKYHDPISKAMAQMKKNTLVVACIIDDANDVLLAQNSLKSFIRLGGSKNDFFVIRRKEAVACKGLSAKCLSVLKAMNLGGSISDEFVGRNFLQAWLAFAAADSGANVLWQSPGTVWMQHPTKLMESVPKSLDTMFLFKGREDARAAPFHVSSDLFYASSSDRSIHLMHEIMLHADLMVAWRSLDATVSYRLSENNARYGTSTHILPPHQALNTILMNHHSPTTILEAAMAPDPPSVIVFPRSEMESEEIVKVMKEAKLWLI